jgi:hypothetical protein
MAAKFSCWVIVSGAHATAFRSRYAEDLQPTLKQLQRTDPEATVKWFERGRLWESPEAAKEAPVRAYGRSRGKDWRPGGAHVDPRAKYEVTRDQKRARFKKRLVAEKTSLGPGGSRLNKRRPPKDDK